MQSGGGKLIPDLAWTEFVSFLVYSWAQFLSLTIIIKLLSLFMEMVNSKATGICTCNACTYVVID